MIPAMLCSFSQFDTVQVFPEWSVMGLQHLATHDVIYMKCQKRPAPALT